METGTAALGFRRWASSIELTWRLKPDACFSNLRVEIEECFETCLQLFLNLILAAFEHMHSDVRLAAIFEFYGRIPQFSNLLRGQQPQSINQRQICHVSFYPQD